MMVVCYESWYIYSTRLYVHDGIVFVKREKVWHEKMADFCNSVRVGGDVLYLIQIELHEN